MRISLFCCLLLSIILLGGRSAFGQIQTNSPFQNTAPPTAVGSGARAMGIGGAFISIADDATAATWNPGGLVQLLTPEMSLVMTNEQRRVNGDDTSFNEINYLSIVYPFAVGNINFVTSMNYQRMYDHNYQEDFDLNEMDIGPIGEFVVPDPAGFVFLRHTVTTDRHLVGNKDIEGAIGSLSPSLAVQLTPRLSVGFTYNFWEQGFIGPRYSYQYQSDNAVTVTTSEEQFWQDTNGDCLCGRLDGPGLVACDDPNSNSILDNPECLDTMLVDTGTPPTSISRNATVYEKQKLDFEGQSYNVGLLFKASPRWTLGAVYRSEYVADIDREYYLETRMEGVAAPTIVRKGYHEQLRFPASYGVGAAFRYSDEFTLTADVTRTEWDRFTLMPEHGRDISPVSRLPMGREDVDPTTTYRLGAEYLFIGPRFVVPLRGGIFYDPEPGVGRPDDYYGFSVGSGLVYNQFAVDAAYWYRWGDDVIQSVNVIQDPYNLTRDIDVERGHIHRQMLMMSAVVHFN